jgi:medium-chain acyl-[acyl-carrier-protein] hydrolase
MKYTESDLILRIEDRIPMYFVSLNRQIKFFTLTGMLLEGAAIHSSLHGYGYDDMMRDKVYWVLSRFHVIMHSYPRMGEKVVIETWHKGANRLFFLRDYRMLSEDNRLLASATSAWLVLDGNTGRPKKMDDANPFYEFDVDNLHSIESVPDKLPKIPEPDSQINVTARYSDLDINKHVNAIKYIEWVQDHYDEEVYKTKNVQEFQINYQLETRFGEEVEVRMKRFSEDDQFDYFEGIRTVDKNPAFRARISFGDFNE